jgi:hypothetical protein
MSRRDRWAKDCVHHQAVLQMSGRFPVEQKSPRGAGLTVSQTGRRDWQLLDFCRLPPETRLRRVCRRSRIGRQDRIRPGGPHDRQDQVPSMISGTCVNSSWFHSRRSMSVSMRRRFGTCADAEVACAARRCTSDRSSSCVEWSCHANAMGADSTKGQCPKGQWTLPAVVACFRA